jgi:putative membrane protein
MTLVMQIAHRWPRPEREALPPQQITEEITDRVGLDAQLDAPKLAAAVWAAHFGFGAAAGALYAQFFSKIKAPTPLKGVVWGLFIWSISYLGWVPAAQILPPATEQSARRNGLMIGAHLVWGIVLAHLVEANE